MRLILPILLLILAGPALAQTKPDTTQVQEMLEEDAEDRIDPYRDPGRTLPYLAYTMGQLHFLDYACGGNEQQDWRNRMIELLQLEAPISGFRRDRLIDAFNDGYQAEQRARIRCGAEAEAERRNLARRGQQMSQALLNEVLD
ncbi:TIGR02301 family protein [Hyphobacterium sp. HN65]|uniref:TIGR02301 family protein n=1 Tax=Hyphobacterium lacteum TaxID=3116575 RepID=A0ABU7LMU3_9PROT|nr:TIGR02301 family protein [Hyphobacterium sp. HN65]MEE2525243.1 TIGR02301 family protein [Hyphobacterium sp. HN65]